MMSEKVFLVMASEGSHSDRSEWNVAAYSTLEQAEDHVRRASEYTKSAAEMDDWEERRDYLMQSIFDPLIESYNCSAYAVYWVLEVPFVRHVDEFLELGLKRESDSEPAQTT